VWAVCVFICEAAGRARGRSIYGLLTRYRKNYWADFNEIWQECFMVHASYLINFWMTLTKVVTGHQPGFVFKEKITKI
jgi:hypothetical protein